MWDFGRVALMEEHQPGAWDLVVLNPLRQPSFAKAGDSHHLCPATHDVDNFLYLHAQSLDFSIHLVKKYLDHRLAISCFNPPMDKRAKKYENRRARLMQLIDERAKGSKAGFARMYGFERAQIGQYTSSTYNNGYTPGEGVIEKLEDRLGLPQGWFDQPADGSADWPFPEVDEEKVRALDEKRRTQLETLLLDGAARLGLDIKKTD